MVISDQSHDELGVLVISVARLFADSLFDCQIIQAASMHIAFDPAKDKVGRLSPK